jgi:ubiquinone/menaquinone biosynthesis C-methylase UbiE
VADTKQAEKAYLARTGSADWERLKPFSPPGADTLVESLRLLHDFSVAVMALQPAPGDRILDLGAGGCWCSDLLSRLNRSTVAIDISVDMLRTGRTRAGGAGLRAVAGDLERLPFADASFDKAICLSAIHHVPDIPAALREISRVLADDGMVFFSEPGRGHAEAAVSTAAMRDYGVLEQDILIDDFARACADAGFGDVRLKLMSYAIPEFDLTIADWTRWSGLARSKRPVRALDTLRRGLVELMGGGKRSTLLEETHAMSVVRLLRGAAEDHPMILASKRPIRARSQAPWAARIEADGLAARARAGGVLRLRVMLTNAGSSAWRPRTSTGTGQVMLGVQLLDAEGRVVNRDYFRAPLPSVIGPGDRMPLTFDCPLPAGRGRCQLKLDLVAEGVTWFEAVGSPVLTHAVDLE